MFSDNRQQFLSFVGISKSKPKSNRPQTLFVTKDGGYTPNMPYKENRLRILQTAQYLSSRKNHTWKGDAIVAAPYLVGRSVTILKQKSPRCGTYRFMLRLWESLPRHRRVSSNLLQYWFFHFSHSPKSKFLRQNDIDLKIIS